MPARPRIDLYCLCWNDDRMLPFFFKHYDDIVDRYFIFDNGSTDESLAMLESHGRVEVSHFTVLGDSFVDEERRLCDTIWRESDADWVIITDIDEHIYRPDLVEYLGLCTKMGITAIRSIGYEMVSDTFPSGSGPLYELVTRGVRSVGHDRLCIFNPRAITETNFNPGRHVANPRGRVIWPYQPEVLVLHYKQLGIDYVTRRSAELRQGLREGDLKENWGKHYAWSAGEIALNWQSVSTASGPVPGLGTLKNVEPAKYFGDEGTITRSGLVDRRWYLDHNPDVRTAGLDPLSHFCVYGWKEDRWPNYYFNMRWYRKNYPEICATGRNPLLDYIVRGEKQDTWPSPQFNTSWYRARHGLSENESPLRHYLQRRLTGLVSPVPDFDVAKYCERNPEVLIAKEDPFEMYFEHL